MFEQIDQLQTVACRLNEVYAITCLMAEHFGPSTPSESEKTKAFALAGDLMNIVTDILGVQKGNLMEIINTLSSFESNPAA